jgi:heat shock protein HslJ
MRSGRTIVIAIAFGLPACAALEQKEPPPKPLVGTRWEAILELPPQGEQPWIRVGDGRLEGFGGCNRINARYVRDTVGARAIAIGVISTGRRACDQNSAAVESGMLDVLQSVSSYQVTGDLLVMTGSAGSVRFRAVSDAPAAGVDVSNTRWVAIGVEEWGTGNAPRLEFSGDGRVNGYTGCNSLGGRYAITGDVLEVIATTTKRACAGTGADFERRFLEALADKPRIAVVGPKMVLTGSKGGKLEFIAQTGAPVR